MRWLATTLWSAFAMIVIGGAVNILSNPVGDWVKDRLHLELALQLSALVGLAAALAQIGARRSKLRGEFDLFTSSDALKPRDVGFVRANPEEAAKRMLRPYFPTYIPRTAIQYSEHQSQQASRVYDEAQLLQILERGESLLLVGIATEGKTRSLFELVRRLKGRLVVRPHRDRPPSDDALALLKGKDVVCLFDDINKYAGTPTDLLGFTQRVAAQAKRSTVAGACRAGPELDSLSVRTTSMYALFESIPHHLMLLAASDDEKRHLRAQVGGPSGHIFTLGSICMADAFAQMGVNFRRMDSVTRDTHSALQLLAVGGVEPFTQARVRAVLASVFGREMGIGELGDQLDKLQAQGFLLSNGDADPIVPEAAFLRGPPATALYHRNRDPEADLPRLAGTLIATGDAGGLFALAWSRSAANDREGQISFYARLAEAFGSSQEPALRDLVANSLFNRACTLGLLERWQEEIDAYGRVIGTFGDDPAPSPALRVYLTGALNNMALRLVQLDRGQEAIDAFDRLIRQFGDDPPPAVRFQVATAFYNRGNLLGQLGRWQEAIDAYDRVIHQFGDDTLPAMRAQIATAMCNKGLCLSKLGQLEDAIGTYDQVTHQFGRNDLPELREPVAGALINKGNDLDQMGRWEEALEEYGKVIRQFGDDASPTLRQQVTMALCAKSDMLKKHGRWQEASDAFDLLISRFDNDTPAAAREDVATALAGKGFCLLQLGRWQAAIDAYDRLIHDFGDDSEVGLRERVAVALVNKGVSHGRLDRWREEFDAYDRVVRQFGDDPLPTLREQVAMALFNKGLKLGKLDRFDEELDLYSRVIEQFGDDSRPAVREVVTWARANRHAGWSRLLRPAGDGKS